MKSGQMQKVNRDHRSIPGWEFPLHGGEKVCPGSPHQNHLSNSG